MEKEAEKIRKQEERERREKYKYVDKTVNSILGAFTRQIGREMARGILGSFKRKNR